MIRSFFILVTFFISFSSLTQQSFEVDVLWMGDYLTTTKYEEEIKILALNHEYDDDNFPTYIYRYYDKSFSTQDVDVSVLSVEYANASAFDKLFFKDNNLIAPSELKYSYKIVSAQGKYYVGI